MDLQTLLKTYLVDDAKVTEFLGKMKENKIYTASEENLDTRYSKLKGEHDTLTNEHTEATKLIEQLKTASTNDKELQDKINDYENNVIPNLKQEAENAKIEGALKTALVSAKVTDIDYVAYKIKEKGKELKLDEKGNIENIEETLKDIKVTYPTFFQTEAKKEIDVKQIGSGKAGTEPEPQSLQEALAMKYSKKEEM